MKILKVKFPELLMVVHLWPVHFLYLNPTGSSVALHFVWAWNLHFLQMNHHFWSFFHYPRQILIKKVCSDTHFYCKFCYRIKICGQLDYGNNQRCQNFCFDSRKFVNWAVHSRYGRDFDAVQRQHMARKFKTDNVAINGQDLGTQEIIFEHFHA